MDSIFAKKIQKNQAKCNVTVDTSQLRADNKYEREIVLESNAQQEKHYLKLNLKTATCRVNIAIPPYLLLAGIYFILAFFSGTLMQRWMWMFGKSALDVAMILGFGMAILATFSMKIGQAIGGAIGGAICGGISLTFFGLLFGEIGVIFGGIVGGVFGGNLEVINEVFTDRGYSKSDTALYLLLTSTVGILTGIAIVSKFPFMILVTLAAIGSPLAGMLIIPPIKQQRLRAHIVVRNLKI
jgi:hypothetical protein